MPKAERNTRQKQAIYGALVSLGHPSATEVYEYVRAAQPNLSRGTVFRVLAAFAESGRARRLCFEGSDDRFDATLAPHAHARCRVCGAISDVFFDPPNIVCAEGFTVESVSVELSGVCKHCAERAN